MENYEIRIVKKGSATVIYACRQASDYAVVRRAHSLAGPEDQVEVWRKLDGVFTTRQMELAAH